MKLDAAANAIERAADERQPYPRASVVALIVTGLAERQEDGSVPFAGNAGAVVGDGDGQCVTVVPRHESDASARPIVVLDGVIDEVAQNEIERRGEGRHSWPVAADFDGHAGRRSDACSHTLDERARVDDFQRVVLAADPGVVEQAVQHCPGMRFSWPRTAASRD